MLLFLVRHRKLFSFLCAVIGCASLEAVPFHFTLDYDVAGYKAVLSESIGSFFSSCELTCLCEERCDIEQSAALVNQSKSLDDLARAFYMLTQQKQLYAVQGDWDVVQGKLIGTCQIQTVWIFEHLKLTGPLIGKERYRRFYTLEVGDRFTQEAHEHALENMRQRLCAQGYCAAVIETHFEKKQDTKTVVVCASITPGKRFVIDKVTFCFDKIPDGLVMNVHSFQQKVQTMCERALCGGYYTEESVQEEIDRIDNYLAAKGLFGRTVTVVKTYNPATASVALSICASSKQKKRYEFLGNSYFSTECLLDIALPFGDSGLLAPPSLIADEIKVAYKKSGFWDACITWQEENDRVFFTVHEGERMRLSGVQVQGITCMSEQECCALFFAPLLKYGWCDTEEVAQALNTLLASYRAQAFWDCKIIHNSFVVDTVSSAVLQIQVDEGEQNRLAAVCIEPYNGISLDHVIAHVGEYAEPPLFDRQLLIEHKKKLQAWLIAHGYIYAKPVYALSKKTNGWVVTWSFVGNLEPVVFGKTVVVGYSHLPSSYITRELDYKEGDMWDVSRIERSLQRLRNLGIFESVSLYPLHMSEPEASKSLVIKYVMDDPYEVRVRAGAQLAGNNLQFSAITYKLGGSFVWKNCTQAADTLRFDGDVTRYIRDLEVTYARPWLGDLPLKTEIKAYSVRFDQPLYPGSKYTLYRLFQDGFLCGLHHDYNAWSLGVDSGFEWMELDDLSTCVARAIYFDPVMVARKTPFFFMEPTAIADYLDNNVSPNVGTKTFLSCKVMVPLQNPGAFFAKIQAEHTMFLPLGYACVGACRLRLGHIFNQDFSQILPSERFYLGGVHSLRGYEPDLAPPLNLLDCPDHPRVYVAVGGKSMANCNLEVRFPLIGSLGSVLFSDFGLLVQNHFSDISSHTMLAASGFGLRYNTPVGPLSFDIGWKWRKHYPQECSFAWFLTLGQAF